MRTILICTMSTVLVLLILAPAPAGEKKTDTMSDQQFARLLTVFLEDPLQEKNKEIAKALIIFTMQTPKAAVMLGDAEIKWLGKKDDDRGILLFAAYLSGNTQAQLLSGVKQNDRYSGMMTLFSVYRRLQAKDKKFQIAEIDRLRRLHAEGKLLAHVVELEKKMPTKLSPEDVKKIQELLKKK